MQIFIGRLPVPLSVFSRQKIFNNNKRRNHAREVLAGVPGAEGVPGRPKKSDARDLAPAAQRHQ